VRREFVEVENEINYAAFIGKEFVPEEIIINIE